MSQDLIARALEPFFTTRAGRGGTGLGLDSVRHTVETTLGGSLELSSQPGVGTCFRIDLPRG